MTNPFYNPSGTPGTGTIGSSAAVRAEFDLIADGFDLLPPTLTANKAVIINSAGTGMTVTTGSLALAGNFTTTGAFNTTLVAGATVSITLPIVSGLTLATLTGTETLTNKTLTSPTITSPTISGTTTMGALIATTGAFSSTVSMTALTATTGAFSGAITGASYTGGAIGGTTGTFSGAVSMTALTATTGAFSSTVSMTALTATTGAFSGAITGASYTGGAIGGTTGTFSGAVSMTALTATTGAFSSEVTLTGSEGNQLNWTLGGQSWEARMVSGAQWYLTDTTNGRYPIQVFNNTTAVLSMSGATSTFTGAVTVTGTITSSASTIDTFNGFTMRGANVAVIAGNYNQIYDASSRVALYLGNASDKTNYYDNDAHIFRAVSTGTVYSTLNSTGLGVGVAPSYKFHVYGSNPAAVIQTSTATQFGGPYLYLANTSALGSSAAVGMTVYPSDAGATNGVFQISNFNSSLSFVQALMAYDLVGNAWTFYTGGTSRLTISSAGVTTISATTASTSKTTGALIVGGGVGVAGKLFATDLAAVAGSLSVTGSASITNVASTGYVFQNTGEMNLWSYGPDTSTNGTFAIVSLRSNASNQLTVLYNTVAGIITVPYGLTIGSGYVLKLGNAYTAGAIVPSGWVTLQDSTGTSYKVAVVVA